jgi:hypothetical protein
MGTISQPLDVEEVKKMAAAIIIKHNHQWLIRGLHNTTVMENPFLKLT